MAKTTKKKNRRLKRQIRKTVGALLMVSAITVAAIPVQDVSATPTDKSEKIKVAVTTTKGDIPGNPAVAVEHGYPSTVPYARDYSDIIVYSSGDGMFQFAYGKSKEDTSMSNRAIILNFDNVDNLDTITIPNQLEAYRKYNPNVTSGQFCLVTQADEFLMYKRRGQQRDDGPDGDGELLFRTDGIVGTYNISFDSVSDLKLSSPNVIQREDGNYYYHHTKSIEDPEDSTKTVEAEAWAPLLEQMGDVFYPCYYETRAEWENDREEDLYYIPKIQDPQNPDKIIDGYGTHELVGESTDHRRIRADVAYIGAEYVTEKADKSGWEVGEVRPQGNGVFSGRKDLTNIIFEGGNLRGIADYSFYGCWTLSKVEFKSGSIETIGNGAFANCGQLESVTIPRNANLDAIGKDAFYGCESLREFTIPDGLEAIGDCAFENCLALESVNLLGSGKPVMLRYLGNHLFRGCKSLTSIEFPDNYSETLDIDIFKGCTSLQYVKVPDTATGAKLNFASLHHGNTTDYPYCAADEQAAWDNFKKEVPESFYFEGPVDSLIHTTANDKSVTYKYPNQELYEKVVYEHDKNDASPDDRTAKTIYQVNNQGDLVKFGILDKAPNTPSHPDVITIPEKVGAFQIERIGQGSFNNNCDLVQVTIPASVKEIGANAFKGCHDLRSVTFTDASTITSIGADAFKTQETGCEHSKDLYPATGAKEPELYFVGAMLNEETGADTVPFQYAMNGSSKISHDKSPDLWITCHSGWPTNLKVQYSDGEAQLVGYPRCDQLDADWVNNLPYVLKNSDQATEYTEMVNHVKAYLSPGSTISLTPMEQQLLASIRNVAIPASVDSIREGLFSGINAKGEAVDADGEVTTGDPQPDTYLQSVLINGVEELDPYTFKGCKGLERADVIGSELINDYAFDECVNLTGVTLGTNLKDTGKRPFRGCASLNAITCMEPSLFTYSNGILYRNTNSGKEIAECLESRGAVNGSGSYNVGPDELSGVTSMKDEAFEACKNIAQIDLSKTTINTIPESCFKDMELNSITLPSTLKAIEKGAFQDRGAKRMVVYFKGDPIRIEEDAFDNTAAGDPDETGDGRDDSAQNLVIFQCQEGSNADFYATVYPYINSSDDEVYQEWTVIFYNLPDYPLMTNQVLLDKQTVRSGEDAVPPPDPTCNDPELEFSGWSEYTNIQRDTDVFAIYGSPEYTVTFIDGYNGDVLKTEKVKRGGTATPPADDELPEHPGQVFMGWDKPHYNISADTTIVARFVDGSGDINRFTVSFYLRDTDEEPWWTTHASDGEVVMAPMVPADLVPAGYTFSRWLWTPASSATGVKQDTSVYAQWTRGNGGSNPSASPGNGGNSGNNGNSGNGSGSNSSPSPSSSTSPSPSSTPGVKKYTVSVSGGSGSGEYAAGEIVAVNAYYMGEGQAFDKWTSSTAGVGFSNPNATSATFTMPAANVAVTATYKTGSGNSITPISTNSGGGGGSNTVNTVSNNGTTVDVTRPGISNTNLAGATVSGATDNFIVKVTEDQNATDAVTAALQARYGDLSRIKYLPMDISLYDSTGRTKIADTSGISVNLTLPLPDDLVQYAGNNRVAAVSGGVLEDLNARFTTVAGVPCVNFTATHFSPYVIYVDTANLSEAVIDATPKTGDPIHPKWFLAIGLACVSLIMFFKRDKKVVINTKTA